MLKSKVEAHYEIHNCERICQGDILRDFKFTLTTEPNVILEIFFQYLIIISQDCDLEHCLKKSTIPESSNFKCNQFLPNILFIPAFPMDKVKNGEHLVDLYNIKQDRIGSDLWKPITKNLNDRYHFLKSNLNFQVPDLVVDFKLYQTIPTETFLKLHKESYLTSVNELFRENLSQRFTNYFSRIALPEFH